MQARRPFVMEVAGGASMRDALAAGEAPATCVVLWEGATLPLTTVLPDQADSVRLLVGPEGGFSDEEIESAREAGAALASLGPGILRTETAAVVAAAIVWAHYGRLG